MGKKLYAILAAITLVLGISAQTQLSAPQLAPAGDGRVWVNYNNQVRQALIDGGELVEKDGDLVLRFAAPAAVAQWVTEQQVVATAPATFTLAMAPVNNSLIVFRNGLAQWIDDDYAQAGMAVTLPFAEVGDRVVMKYQTVP